MVYTEKNFTKFLENFPDKINVIENQLIDMHANCFGNSEWSPYSNMGVVIDIDEKTLEVKGFLNFFENDEDENIAEIYSVCVNPKYRNQGILGKLLYALPEEYYYYLEVLFENRNAYSAYLKYFFCDFIGIGTLSFGGEPAFILGGRVTTKCEPEKRNQLTEQLDLISNKIDQIDKEFPSIKFNEFFEHFENNFKTYKLIHEDRNLLKLYNTDKTKLSEDVIKVLEFPDRNNKISNPLFDYDSDVLKLMINYDNEISFPSYLEKKSEKEKKSEYKKIFASESDDLELEDSDSELDNDISKLLTSLFGENINSIIQSYM
jgi:GNAT superfamily N-acetyltransferase